MEFGVVSPLVAVLFDAKLVGLSGLRVSNCCLESRWFQIVVLNVVGLMSLFVNNFAPVFS